MVQGSSSPLCRGEDREEGRGQADVAMKGLQNYAKRNGNDICISNWWEKKKNSLALRHENILHESKAERCSRGNRTVSGGTSGCAGLVSAPYQRCCPLQKEHAHKRKTNCEDGAIVDVSAGLRPARLQTLPEFCLEQ